VAPPEGVTLSRSVVAPIQDARYDLRMSTLWVGIGGALGSMARFHIGLFALRRWPAMPWGTLAVNILGSLLLSLLMHLVLRGRIDETTRIALGVGVLGGFTTYSSFNHETIALAQQGAWGRAALYVVITLVGCFAAGILGWTLARAV
jgi:fluoride exporter